MLGFKRGRREARGFGSMPWALSRGGREVWGFSGSKLQGWGSGVSVGGFRGLSQRGEIETLGRRDFSFSIVYSVDCLLLIWA